MKTSNKTLSEIKAAFQRQGGRFTAQKETIWRLFVDHPRGLTLAQAVAMLRQSGISQATVYRVVRALHDLGFLRYFHGQEGDHRYLASRPGHFHHLVCRGCGQAAEVADCDLGTLEKLLAAKTGYIVEGHHLEFFGLCPQCGALPHLHDAN